MVKWATTRTNQRRVVKNILLSDIKYNRSEKPTTHQLNTLLLGMDDIIISNCLQFW